MVSADELRAPIEHLAAIDRASCSTGEHEAAEWIAAALRERGARARVERERVHGTYWWPLGVTSALGVAAALAARRDRRLLAGLLGGAGAALAVDDMSAGRRWLRRRLPQHTTANVVAEAGDPDGSRTVIVVSHHDAAHTGFFMNPALWDWLADHLPSDPGDPPSPPMLAPVFLGPAAAGLAGLAGARRLATAAAGVCAGIIAVFTEMALRQTVPGANDNLTGVATVLALARELQQRPVSGLRVLLVSTGSEEAHLDGMWAFARRHFAGLDRARTHLLCVDTVGSPHLVLFDAEGMAQVRDYDPELRRLIVECAAATDTPLITGVTLRLCTDGYVALRHGLSAASLGSVDDHGAPSNYHWPTDTPDRVDYGTLAHAAQLCEAVVRRLADGALDRG